MQSLRFSPTKRNYQLVSCAFISHWVVICICMLTLFPFYQQGSIPPISTIRDDPFRTNYRPSYHRTQQRIRVHQFLQQRRSTSSYYRNERLQGMLIADKYSNFHIFLAAGRIFTKFILCSWARRDWKFSSRDFKMRPTIKPSTIACWRKMCRTILQMQRQSRAHSRFDRIGSLNALFLMKP